MWIRWTLMACWALTVLVWVVGGVYNAWKSPPVQRRELPVSWILGGCLYILVRYVIPPGWIAAVTYPAVWMTWIGAAVLAGSTAFTIYSRVALGTMWSSEPSARSGHELRTKGPYAITRNPIYTGLLGMTMGSGLLSGWGVWLVVLVGATGIFLYKIRLEEKLLRDTFGSDFEAYVQRVPRLVPGVRGL